MYNSMLYDPVAYEGLPVLEPAPPPRIISDEEILRERQSHPKDAEMAKAEAFCLAGDVTAATASITELLQKGRYPQRFHFCLVAAALSGSETLVEMLLDVGVAVNLNAVKPAIKSKSLPILSLFIQRGWKINEEEGWCVPSLFSYALGEEPNESLVSWFLDNGADPNARCQMDITPLSTAAGCAPLAIVKQLFAHLPLDTPIHGQLLHWAARRTSDDADSVVELILERCQPDINKIEYEDHVFSYEVRKCVGLGTALHETAKMGKASVAQILIQRGVDISIRDSLRNTALDVAEHYENHAVAALLSRAEKSLGPKM